MKKRWLALILAISLFLGMFPVSTLASDTKLNAGNIVKILSDAEEPAQNDEMAVRHSSNKSSAASEQLETQQKIDTTVTENEAGEFVTRVQWLRELTTLFEMTVDADNLPDNYFSDLESETDAYYDMLLAVEFGLVDIEPGGEIKPEEPATREFAAHTLNFCLGFQVEDETIYTFSDAESITYQADAQIAVNRGWFALIDGAFIPDATVTVAEAEAMLADAEEVWNSTQIDENYDNTYEFSDGVIVFPDTTLVSLDENDIVTIFNCQQDIAEGDTLAIFVNQLPSVFIAESVTVDGNKTIITTSEADVEQAIESVDAQGIISCDEADFTPAEGVTVTYSTEESATERGTTKIKRTFSKTVDLGNGINVGISVQPENLYVEYLAAKDNGGSDYMALKGDLTITATASVDFVKAAGESATVTLGSFGIPGVGEIALVVEVMLKGTVTYTYMAYVCAGVEHSSAGFRTVTRFEKKAFSMCSEVEASIGLKLYAYLDALIFKGTIYARTGLAADLTTNSYTDGELPMSCTTFTCWLYAEVGYSVNWIQSFGQNESVRENITIFDNKNSPIQLFFHIEDGVYVQDCARNPGKWYTPASSKYGYYGSRSASSKGVDGDGEVFTIFTYTLDDSGNATITGYQGNVSALMIPETLDGNTVVAIGSNAFKGNTRLVCVVVPNTVTSIGDSAFYGCTSMTTIFLPNSVTTIGNSAFSSTGLMSLTLPEKIETLGEYALTGTAGVTTISIPQSVTSMNRSLKNSYVETVTFEAGMTNIPYGACDGDTYLKNVAIPDTVTAISSYSFIGCTSLEAIELPPNLESLGVCPFANTGLKTIFIPKTLRSIDTSGWNWKGPFEGDNLISAELESGMTTVPECLFAGCTSLTTVIIPDTVTALGTRCFANCKALESIELPNNLESIGSRTFLNAGLKTILIPKTLKNVDTFGWNYWAPFEGCGLVSVEFENGTTEIPVCLFQLCQKLTDVSIPETVKTIANRAFNGCSALTEITIPESVESIGVYAFTNSGLQTVSLPDSVTSIDSWAYSNCTSLTNAVIPNSVASMGSGIFSGCTSLMDVTLSDACVKIMDSTFEGCTALETITLPDTVTTIQSKTFKDCTSLKTINWSDSLKTIGDSAFYGCSALETVQVPETVTSIENSAFRDCDALVSITIPDSVTSFGDYMFQDSDALTDVQLGTGITEIKQYSFEHCDSLVRIVLPYRVATISDSAFMNCVVLTEITIPRATTTIATTAFSYPDKLTIYGVSDTYAETFANENGITFVPQNNPATEVYLSSTELTLNKGQSTTLTMTVVPKEFTDAVSWKSSNTAVATISDTGLVSAVGVGTATIKLIVGNISTCCTVTVVQPVTSIKLNNSSLTLEALETYQLVGTVSPTEAHNKEIVWSSSDTEVVTVDENGLVTALVKGTATITVTAQDGSNVTSSCQVTVTNTAHVAETVEELESDHNYTNNCNDFWLYRIPKAEEITVSFDERTKMEDGFDYLNIFDAEGNEIGSYTGTELSGVTITIPGDTVKIKMSSDDSGTEWGFKVTAVTTDGKPENTVTKLENSIRVTAQIQGEIGEIATVPCAAYDAYGKQIAVGQMVKDENGLWTVELTCDPTNVNHVKVFAMGVNNNPVAEEKMIRPDTQGLRKMQKRVFGS